MNIVLVNDDMPPEVIGGSGTIIVEVASKLVKLGHVVTIVTASNLLPNALQVPSGVRIRIIPRLPQRWAHYRSVFSQARALEVSEVIRSCQPDIVHAHALAWQMGYRWIPLISSIAPVFYTAHGMMTISYGKLSGLEHGIFLKDLRRARWTLNPLRNIFIRRYLSYCKRIFTVSNALRHQLSRYGHPAGSMEVLHNGIDTDVWKPVSTQLIARERLGLPFDRPLFFLAGRLGHDKGLDFLLSLWPRLSQRPLLILAGMVSPSYHLPAESVRVFPKQDADGMRLLYTACDVNLVPSLCFDCFPTTSLEAMSCERPVLVTTRGGGKEAVKDGDVGFVIDPMDPEAWFTKLQWCIQQRDAVREMGVSARQHVIASFSMEKHCSSLLDRYQTVISGSRSPLHVG